jgi:hypothetical protein
MAFSSRRARIISSFRLSRSISSSFTTARHFIFFAPAANARVQYVSPAEQALGVTVATTAVLLLPPKLSCIDGGETARVRIEVRLGMSKARPAARDIVKIRRRRNAPATRM